MIHHFKIIIVKQSKNAAGFYAVFHKIKMMPHVLGYFTDYFRGDNYIFYQAFVGQIEKIHF